MNDLLIQKNWNLELQEDFEYVVLFEWLVDTKELKLHIRISLTSRFSYFEWLVDTKELKLYRAFKYISLIHFEWLVDTKELLSRKAKSRLCGKTFAKRMNTQLWMTCWYKRIETLRRFFRFSSSLSFEWLVDTKELKR